MGEEEEKLKETEKPADDEKKEESAKIEEKKDETKEEKQSEESKAEQPPLPPPPPQEIVLKVDMHCEGCATKVRRCLKGFEGVEDVKTDYLRSKVVVKGEKADPLKVLERIQRKSHRQVELISPIPKPLAESQKPEEKEEVMVKSEEKKEEPPVIIVVLGVYMHCEACAQEIKRRIERMKGVENAEPDLKKSQVIVKGVFEPEKLVEYVHKKTGKHAAILGTAVEKEEDGKGKGGEQEKKVEEGEKEAKKAEENKGNGGDGGEPPSKPAADGDNSELEMKKNEYYYYYSPHNPQKFVPEWYAYEYPPQMFSDENPNACIVI